MNIKLEDLGYTEEVAKCAEPYHAGGYTIARVTQMVKQRYLVRTEALEIPAEVSGRFMFTSRTREEYPVVGDWVAVTLHDQDTHAVIHHVLPRRTVLQRRAPGKRIENQIIATNVDAVFIIFPLNQSWTPHALERYLILVRQSGAQPYVFLSKRDVCTDDHVRDVLGRISTVCANETVSAYSLYDAADIHYIASFIHRGTTFCLIGPSGAGKSSLINALVGKEVLPTGEVREYDAKGRHITTKRQLVVLEKGGVLIDTPGMREVGLWQAEDGLWETFDDILEIGTACKFRDCTHTHEPQCAVRKAVEEKILAEDRYNSYIRYYQELHELATHLNPKELKERRELEQRRSKQEKILKLKKR
ncbi:MAG: ribosome small subunit-dependent GTPase A [Bacteroidetes bacterium]|nr:ribosome small subunit-dependent GTPase A [Bacteroidota bacterium]